MVQPKTAPAVNGEWECMECGYVEEGNELQRPAHCPECNAASDAFEFFSYEDEEWEGDFEDDDEDEEDLDEDLEDDFDELDGEAEDYEFDDEYDELEDER